MRLRRRDILLLFVAWVFVAVALVVTLMVLRSRSLGPAGTPRPAATYTVTFTQVTARGLYPTAEALALAWQPSSTPPGRFAAMRASCLSPVALKA
jgi:hypothetical protein